MNPDDAQIESDRGDEHMDNVSYALTPTGRLQVVNDRVQTLRAEVDMLHEQVQLLTVICSDQQRDITELRATTQGLIDAGFVIQATLDTHTKTLKLVRMVVSL